MIVKSSPNIAFIKYWGKRESTSDLDINIGTNTSLSMTLKNACTTVDIQKTDKETNIKINNSDPNTKDLKKITAHHQRICDYLKVSPVNFSLTSSNNFPQGTGIASSASAFSALTLGFLSLYKSKSEIEELLNTKNSDISALSRRGSGSAARSTHGPFMIWKDTHAETIDVEWKLFDTVIIFSKTEKKLSSTDGHKLASTSPKFKTRLNELPARTTKLLKALRAKNLNELGPILEEEALNMHSVMQSTTPPFNYLSTETEQFLEVVQKLNLRNFYFTLDAGPNVHLISEKPIADEIAKLLKKHKLEAEIWEDEAGFGPTIL